MSQELIDKRDKWLTILNDRLAAEFAQHNVTAAVRTAGQQSDVEIFFVWHGKRCDRSMGWWTEYSETYLKYSTDAQMNGDIQLAIRDVREYMAAHPTD
jgi:hypothetical protein